MFQCFSENFDEKVVSLFILYNGKRNPPNLLILTNLAPTFLIIAVLTKNRMIIFVSLPKHDQTAFPEKKWTKILVFR